MNKIPFGKKLIFTAVMFIGVLLLAELLLYIVAYLSPAVKRTLNREEITVSWLIPDEVLGHRPDPDFPEHDRVTGFRNRDYPTRAKIVALGDSQTYGLGVGRENAWPQQLAKLSGGEVYNYGFGGYGPARRRIESSGSQGSGLVHIVKGNVHKPPFKDRIFDLVYSSGVLHHTPDTKRGFQAISRKVKKAGKCYIFLYGNEFKTTLEMMFYHLTVLLRKITVRLPHQLLHTICFAIAPIFWVYVRTGNLISRRQRYNRRSLRELELSLFDAVSPLYRFHHSEKEVREWFVSNGYDPIKKTSQSHIGFGLVGVMR